VLSFACVVVAHTPFGSYPSSTRWLLQFARTSLPASPRAALTAMGVNGDQSVTAAVDAATGKVELRGGISSYGPKRVQSLTVNGQDLTQQLQTKVGTEPTVTSAEGRIAGECPP
jgi:hypothetical protein